MSDYTGLKARAQAAISFAVIPIPPNVILALIVELEDQHLQTQSAREVTLETQAAILSLIAECDRLKAENYSMRKDAERYRWLRDGAGYCDTRDIPGMAPARMDAFIDTALGKVGKP